MSPGLVVAGICVLLLIGCGSEGGMGVEITKPIVVRTSPRNGATGVALIPRISIWFSDEMDESSLGAIGVTGIAAHHVDYDTLDNKATVFVGEVLVGGTSYEVRVPSSVRGEDGQNLGGDYTFSFTTGPVTCENATDYFEPNDATNETAYIEIPGDYPVLSSCGADERFDYFSFTLEEAAKVTFRLWRTDGGPPVNWVAGFQRNVYQIYAFIDSLRVTEEISDYYTFLAGTYILRTGKQDEDDQVVFYRLTVETSAPCPDDAYEDNDFNFEASPVVPGYYDDLVSCYKDFDYYSIEMEAGQALTVTATNLTGGAVYGMLYIADPDYITVAQDSGTHNVLSVSTAYTKQGTYTLVVRWPLATVEYTLSVEVD